MLKKCISILSLITSLLLCIVIAFADEAPRIYGDKVKCKSGEIIDYAVHISNNPGIAAYVVGVSCESEWFYFDDEATQGDFTTEGSISSGNDLRFMNVAWYNADNVDGDGTIFSMKVHVSPSTPNGKYPITIMYSKENTIDSKYNEVEFETVDGSISVQHVAVENSADDVNLTVTSHEPVHNATAWILIGGTVVVIAAIAYCILHKKTK